MKISNAARYDDSGAWVMQAILEGMDAVSHAIAGEPPNFYSEEQLVQIFQDWFEMALTGDYSRLKQSTEGERPRRHMTDRI